MKKCSSCQSTRVIPGARLSSHSGMFGWPDVVIRVPTSAFMGAPASSPASVSVCVDCGSVELRASRLDALRKAYESLAGDALDLSNP